MGDDTPKPYALQIDPASDAGCEGNFMSASGYSTSDVVLAIRFVSIKAALNWISDNDIRYTDLQIVKFVPDEEESDVALASEHDDVPPLGAQTKFVVRLTGFNRNLGNFAHIAAGGGGRAVHDVTDATVFDTENDAILALGRYSLTSNFFVGAEIVPVFVTRPEKLVVVE